LPRRQNGDDEGIPEKVHKKGKKKGKKGSLESPFIQNGVHSSSS
jgi:hypothetical protein